MTDLIILNSIKKQVQALWLISIMVVIAAGIFMGLTSVFSVKDSARWIIVTSSIASIQFWWLNQRALDNHRADESQLLRSLGLGTFLTCIRGLFFCALLGLLSVSQLVGLARWLPGVFYTTGCVIDFFDGYIARRQNHSTLLGSQFDLELDGFGALAGSIAGIWIGQLPLWFLLVGLARYIFVGLLWIQKRTGLPTYDLPTSAQRRVYASFNMGFVSAALFPVFSPNGIAVAAGAFMIPFLIGFTRDWLAASGALKPTSPLYQKTGLVLEFLLKEIIPIGLRVSSVLCMALVVSTAIPRDIEQTILYYGLGAAAIATGFMGRIGALIAMFTTGWLLGYLPLDSLLGFLMAASVWLWLFGTGRYSLWTPEARVLYSRA